MTFNLILILSGLFVIESSTSLARKVGYSQGNPASGLILQSSLGLVSRALIFMFMPLIGLAADNGNLLNNESDILISYIMIPLALFLLVIFRRRVEWFYSVLISRINMSGSYFKSNQIDITFHRDDLSYFRKVKKFNKLYCLVVFAYIPYYMSWPVIIFLLDTYPDSRGFILGLSSVFNGINTILLTLIVDPKLAQLGRYKRIILNVYSDFICIRLISSLLSFLILALVMKIQ